MRAHDRLLILDDDVNVGRTVSLMARNLGVSCRATDRPGPFFHEVEHWRPTHILLDLVMPEMDGVEVLCHLAERRCDARLIISSGVGPRVLEAAERAAREHDLEVAGVISKPFSLVKLRDVLWAPGSPARGPSPGAGRSRRPAAVTEEGLRRAIEERQFEVHYQPKVACSNGAVDGFEALVRWRHPEAGLIMPDRFIGLAESLDLLDPITDQVLEAALGWLWRADRAGSGPPGGHSLALNISARMLRDLGLADRLSAHCGAAGVACSRLSLELTETAAMEDQIAALDLVTRLRVKGFRVSIDDFGTGYSSMAQLARLPFSELKVDKSFVLASPRSGEARTIVRSVVDLAHNLGLKAVAEGVEEADHYQFVCDIGCDLAQGYYIARPMPAPDVQAWLRDRARPA